MPENAHKLFVRIHRGSLMSRRPANFSKADLSRAMSVARENGMTVEIAPDGTIKIVASKTTKHDNSVATSAVERL